MALLRSHGLRAKYEYIGEVEGRVLANWLNTHRGKKDYKRLVRLIRNIEWLRDAWPLPSSDLTASVSEYTNRRREIVREFGRFRPHPVILQHSEEKPGNLTRASLRRKPGVIRFLLQYGPGGIGEAVMHIARLAEGNLLNRVRECDECKRWFYARFRHQRNCSTPCQQAHFRSSKAWKESRKIYMRKYRDEVRENKVKLGG